MNNRKNVFTFYIFILLLLLIKPAPNAAQNGTGFKKYLTYFDRTDCKGLWVNRSILQDKRGVMYFGGEGGLREYDGVSWRSIPVPNDWVGDMAMDAGGTLYIGGNNEIGYLTPDSYGSLHYKSLVPLLNKNQKEFSILGVHAAKEGIYFNAGTFLFRWVPHSGKINAWRPDNEFGLSFTCEDELYIQDINVGLKRMETGALQIVPGYENISGESICMLVPLGSGGKLVGTRSSRLYMHDGTKTVPFHTEARDYIKQNMLINGIRLASGDFALATFFGGVVVIEPTGGIKGIFDRSFGLTDDLVNRIFEDTQGNLWLALEAGIANIENVSPISTYYGPPGPISSLIMHKRVLYIATRKGLYFLTPGGEFQRVPGTPLYCHNLLSTGDSLLLSAKNGVFLVGEKDIVKIIDNDSYTLLQSQLDKKRIWGQTVFGFFSLYRENGRWIKENEFKKNQLIHTVAEDKKGNLWLGDANTGPPVPTKGFFKVNLSGRASFSDPLVNRYYISGGGPSNVSHVFKAAGHVVFSTHEGIFRFQQNKKNFVPNLRLGKELASLSGERKLRSLVEDQGKNIWVLFYDNTVVQAVHQPDETYILKLEPFRRIPPHIEITGIYPGPNSEITWLYGPSIIIRFDTTATKDYRSHFQTLIRKVLANGEPVFNGCAPRMENNAISYRDRNLRFEFSAPFFEGKYATRYRYRLEGHEKNWSPWTPDTKREYTGLEPGNYHFRVQAKNIYHCHGDEAVFQFNILLPWYRTWWAFLFYAAALSMLTYLIVKSRRSIQLEREKQKLEKTVNERTKEINRKNRQLEQQTLRLKEQSEKLKEMDKVKSRFFANISHEFRTPLALIMGPLEQMLARKEENRHKTGSKKKLTLMLRNSQRLLRLIDQLLELSKLESGNVKLQAYRQNIVLFLKGISASFETVTTQHELELSVHAGSEDIPLYFDPWKLEEVFFNLLSNAVKFTPPGGKITMTVRPLPGSVCLSVCDTGPGIPRDQTAHIFDRFYQSDSTHEHHKKGSGIGLAIAKELVELHHGKIEARSSEGKGAEFIIRLPQGNNHFKAGELVEPGEKLYKRKNPGEIPAHFVSMFRHFSGDRCLRRLSEGRGEAPPGPPMTLRESGRDIVLVVEDSADFRKYLRGALETLYRVVTAKNGAEGIQKAHEIVPDLIISDIMMPGVDGYGLCRELKNSRETGHIPIILLTARASEENIVRGLDTGADDYITKPFNSKILCARIKNLIHQRRTQQLQRRRQIAVKPREIEVPSIDETFLNELEAVVRTNLSDPEFNVEQLKKILCMGRTTLYRKITALTGLSPNKFIRTYRLKRAAQLMEANFGNVSQVALEVGFSNMAYFSQCFKEEFNQSPSSFQSSVSGDVS